MPVKRCSKCNKWVSNQNSRKKKAICYECITKSKNDVFYSEKELIAAKALMSLKKLKEF